MPRNAMSEHRIEDDEELAHTGHQGNVWFFPRCSQPFVKVSDHGIVPAGRQCSHVESSPHVRRPTTPNDVAASQQATVPLHCPADVKKESPQPA
jgi:hypothetical protein